MALPTDLVGGVLIRPTFGGGKADIISPVRGGIALFPDYEYRLPAAMSLHAVRVAANQVKVFFGRVLGTSPNLTTAGRYTFTSPTGAPAITTSSVSAGADYVVLTTSANLKPGTYTLHVQNSTAVGTDTSTNLDADLAFTGPDSEVPVVTAPAAGALLNTTTPTYSGTVSWATSVKVYVDNTLVGTPTVTGGAWSLLQPTPLSQGSHTVAVEGVDAAANVSARSSTTSFTVDSVAPSAPLLTVSGENSGKPTYTGTAEAGSTVALYVDEVQVGTAVANASGGWSLAQPSTLAAGSHSVKARATDAAGNMSSYSTTTSFTVDTTRPEVVNLSPAEGEEYEADEVFTFEVVDNAGTLASVEVLVKLPGVYEVVHDGEEFGPNYREEINTRQPIAGGWRFTIRRKGGWPLGGMRLRVRAVDTAGLESD